MAFEDYSDIEGFRRSSHGTAKLRIMKRKDDTKKEFEQIILLEKGFLITRSYPTAESKLVETLTIDLRYSPSLSKAVLMKEAIAVDLVENPGEESESFMRYSIGSNSPPSFSKNIYSQTLNAIFNDRNPVTIP